MIQRIEYLAYAREHFGRRRFDLASSGLPSPDPDELAVPAAAAADPAMESRFQAALAARFEVPVEEVVPCAGASGAVWAVCAALIEAGRTVVAVEEPGYEPLWRVPQALGARVTRFRREPHERFAIDPARVVRAAGPGGVAIVTDLYNPGGVRADPAALAETALALAQSGGFLIVDEVYRDFLGGAQGPATARRLGANVIALSSLTKVYGLSWARAGWAIAPAPVAATIREAIVHAAGWNPPYCSAVGCAALAAMPRLASWARAQVGDKLARAARFVDEHPRLAWVRPDGGVFGLVRTNGLGAFADVSALLAGPMAEREVLVSDGRFFGAPGWFRLAVALPEPLVDEALARLGEAIR